MRHVRFPILTARRCVCTRAKRTDREYIQLLHRDLPQLYELAQHEFEPMWQKVSDVVAGAHSEGGPRAILDLASGGVAQPAMALAQRFVRAKVVASDNNPTLVLQALNRIQQHGLQPRVEVKEIDLTTIAALASSGDDNAFAEAPSIDAVTCSLGLFMVQPSHHMSLLRGINGLLCPAGTLVATVWDEPKLEELGARVLSRVLGRENMPSSPHASASLGGGTADQLLSDAGFEPIAPLHNEVGEQRITLGPLTEDRAFLLGLLPYQGALASLHEQHGMEGVFARAHDAFIEEAQAHVDAESGEVVLRSRYRVLAARKPSK